VEQFIIYRGVRYERRSDKWKSKKINSVGVEMMYKQQFVLGPHSMSIFHPVNEAASFVKYDNFSLVVVISAAGFKIFYIR
jgi:hypothetical protein